MDSKKCRLGIALFLLPCIVLFLFFFAYPIVSVFVTSFAEWRLGKQITFVGLDNFRRLLADENVIMAAKNTGVWMLMHWFILTGTALLVALMTTTKTAFTRFVKVCYLIPNMIPMAVIGFLAYFIYSPTIGLVNGFVSLFTGEPFVHNWLQDQHTAFWTVSSTFILYGGVFTLLLSTQIAAISPEVIESARLECRNEFQIKRYIVVPQIKNMLGTVLIMATVQCLKTFEVIYLTTSGGPRNITLNLPILIHRTVINNSNFGYANAISAVTILIGALCMGVIALGFRMGQSDAY